MYLYCLNTHLSTQYDIIDIWPKFLSQLFEWICYEFSKQQFLLAFFPHRQPTCGTMRYSSSMVVL